MKSVSRSLCFLFLGLSLFSAQTLAQDLRPNSATDQNDQNVPAAAPEQTPKLKSWYFNLGAGIVSPSYSSNATLQSFSNLEKTASPVEIPLSVDVGFYWPVANHFLIGIVDTGFSDAYTISSTSTATTGINSGVIVAGNLMASLEYFPLSEDLTGFFLRADAGYGTIGSSSSSSYFASNGSNGTGTHAAIGYSIPVKSGAIKDIRIPIILGYFSEAVGTGTVTAVQLGGSVMF